MNPARALCAVAAVAAAPAAAQDASQHQNHTDRHHQPFVGGETLRRRTVASVRYSF
jgi:hypothetical protein